MSKQILPGFLVMALAFLFVACQSSNDQVRDEARAKIEGMQTAAQTSLQAAATDMPTTSLEFEEKTFEFGTINQGEVVSHVFNLTNTGENPLLFTNARGSCGCTVPDWPREAIAPGETAEVVVEFNSRGKKGRVNQTVTLIANTIPAQTVLNVSGEVAVDAGPLVNQ